MKLIVLDYSLTSKGVQDEKFPILNPYTHYNYSVKTLSAAKFRFEAKIQRKSALCSNEMSLKRPRTFDRIFARTFDERSLEQITKFAEFRLHYFCTIL